MRCVDCDHDNPSESRYCNTCGNRLPPAPEPEPVVELAPADPIAHEGDGDAEAIARDAEAALERGDLAAAVEFGQRALILSPSLAWAHSIVARAYEQLGENDRARAEYEMALDRDPGREEDAERLQALRAEAKQAAAGRAAAKGDRWSLLWERPAATIGVAATLIALIVVSVIIVAHRGQARRSARQQYAEAMELGQTRYRAGDYTRAVFQFQRACQIRPDDPEAERWLAEAERMRRGLALAGTSPTRLTPGARTRRRPSIYQPIPLGDTPHTTRSSHSVARPTPLPPRKATFEQPLVPNVPSPTPGGPLPGGDEVTPGARPGRSGSRNVTPTPVPEAASREPTGVIEITPSEVVHEPPAPAPPPTSGEQGLALRREAASLRQQGLNHAAAAKYREAIGKLETEIEAGGAGVRAYRKAIESCRAELALCES